MPEFAPTAVDASMPMVEVALANLRRYWSAWHLHEPGARMGDNPEELHDLRLAGRRLEAILRQFRSWLPAPFLRVRPTLKKILRVLGDARDLDVALSQLEKFSRKLPPSDHAAIEPLRRHLESERGRARTRMLSLLDSVSVQKILQKFTLLLTTPLIGIEAVAGVGAARGAGNNQTALPQGAQERGRPDTDSPVEAYHAVRGHVKKLRYVLEAVAVIYGKPADDMLRALHRWQEKLGSATGCRRREPAPHGARERATEGYSARDLVLDGALCGALCGRRSAGAQGLRQGYRKVRGRWKRLRMKFQESAVESAPALPDATP